MSQLFASGSQSIGASASASDLVMMEGSVLLFTVYMTEPLGTHALLTVGLPWLSCKEPTCQCRGLGLAGYSPWIAKESELT